MVVNLKIDADAGWYAGADLDFLFTIYADDALGTPLDLSGRTLLWQLRTDVENENVLSKSTPTDVEVTDAAAGQCTVHIEAEDTIDLKEGWYNFAIMTTNQPRVPLTVGDIYLNKAATP